MHALMKTRAYNHEDEDDLKDYNIQYMISCLSNEGIGNYDELQYEYHRMKMQCTLCESMISRLQWFSIKRQQSVSQLMV